MDNWRLKGDWRLKDLCCTLQDATTSLLLAEVMRRRRFRVDKTAHCLYLYDYTLFNVVLFLELYSNDMHCLEL